MPPYKGFKGNKDLSVSALVSKTGFSLPSAVNLTDGEVDYICECIHQFIQKHKS